MAGREEATGVLGKRRAGLSPHMCLVPLAPPATTAKPNLAAPSKHRRFATQQARNARPFQKKAKKVEEN
jgi:hypothetical protein